MVKNPAGSFHGHGHVYTFSASREVRTEIPNQQVVRMPRESVPRSGRIPKEVGVLLTGSDADGKVFAEETRTVMLSRYGAEVVSRHTLYPEQEMILCRLDMHKEAEVRIVGKIGFQSRSYTYGVAFLDPNITFWDVEFPPLTELEKA
ncbi:MAG: hypothetical protein WBF06_05330, partial [Candidatus Acidiferrales bacterium]